MYGSKGIFYEQVATILNNKITYMSSGKLYDDFFCYLVNLKDITEKAIRKSKREKYSYQSRLFLMSFYEVISKHISVTLGTNSVTNIYKQEIDNDKVGCIFSNVFKKIDVPLRFERKLLSLFK